MPVKEDIAVRKRDFLTDEAEILEGEERFNGDLSSRAQPKEVKWLSRIKQLVVRWHQERLVQQQYQESYQDCCQISEGVGVRSEEE